MTPHSAVRPRLIEGWSATSIIFFVLSIVGLVSTAAFNVQAVIEGRDFLGDWFGSGPAVNSLGIDLFVVAIAGCVLIVLESRRLGIRFAWLYIIASGVTAFAFTFPLFLCVRERRLVAMRRVDRPVH